MEAQDVLADDVQARGPSPLRQASEGRLLPRLEQGREVTEQRIEPHIEGVVRMARHGNAPGQIDAGNGEILQATGHEVLHLPPPRRRHDEARAGHQLGDGLLVARKPKKEIHLIAPLQRAAMDRAFRILRLVGVILEFLTGHAIPALLAPLNHVAVGLDAGKEFGHQGAVARIGGAHKAIKTDAPALPQPPVAFAYGIAVGLGAETGGLGGALNLQTVLIAAGDEGDSFTAEALEAGDGVAGQRGVGAAEVRTVVDVIKGSCEGEGHRT